MALDNNTLSSNAGALSSSPSSPPSPPPVSSAPSSPAPVLFVLSLNGIGIDDGGAEESGGGDGGEGDEGGEGGETQIDGCVISTPSANDNGSSSSIGDPGDDCADNVCEENKCGDG